MAIRRIAVLTSGGDAPGMNAAVRSVVRVGLGLGLEVFGVRDGYHGLMHGNMTTLDSRAVGGILARGGTMLGTARAPEFHTDAGKAKALAHLGARDIGGLVVIGGNGSQSGTLGLSERGLPVVGVASTIDNDLAGVDITIGVDTALGIIVEAVDRLRDTASSHHRAFVVETMVRGSGYLALRAAVATGPSWPSSRKCPSPPKGSWRRCARPTRAASRTSSSSWPRGLDGRPRACARPSRPAAPRSSRGR
jgi:6-phosphofructokinase 1